MPNYCDYSMRVRGKKKNCLLFAKWLNEEEVGNNDSRKIGYRIFDASYDKEELSAFSDEDIVCLSIEGYCAWSTYCCMFPGPFTYFVGINPKDAHLTVPQACFLLGVSCEIFSSEPGMCFAEHFLVTEEGQTVTQDETDYFEYAIEEETYGEFLEGNPNASVKEEDFNRAKTMGDSFIPVCSFLNGNRSWPFSLSLS